MASTLLWSGVMPAAAGLEKSAAIRPFATKKSRLASEKILLADSLATESRRLANRLATKLFGGQRRCGSTERGRARCAAVFVGPRCKGFGRLGSIDRVGEYPPLGPSLGVQVPSLRFSFWCTACATTPRPQPECRQPHHQHTPKFTLVRV